MFDGQEHVPKLLPCSHTICLECLTRSASTNNLTDPNLKLTLTPGSSPPLLATHSSGVLSAES